MKKKIDSECIIAVFWTALLILMIVGVVAYAILCVWAFFNYADTPVTELPAWVWWIMQTNRGSL